MFVWYDAVVLVDLVAWFRMLTATVEFLIYIEHNYFEFVFCFLGFVI